MADAGKGFEIAEVFHGQAIHNLSISLPLEYTIGIYGIGLLFIVHLEDASGGADPKGVPAKPFQCP
ncbi:hypothetical protein D3C86_2121570 [compost metagenome]